MHFLWPSAFVIADLSLSLEGQRGGIIWFGCIDFLGVAGQILDGEKEISTEMLDSLLFPSAAQLLSRMELTELTLPAEFFLPRHLGGG